jgi:putative component of membrane protein insertase Oxa1/YidC/SpoIIIJ protein YidD
MGTLGALLLTVAVATPFGPFGTKAHPRVGPVAAVPGNGPEPVVTQAVEEIPLAKVQAARGLKSRGGSNPLYVSFLLYKNFLSEVDGSRCQHYPTCSAYGAQAVGRHNVLGVLMTMDRLWAAGNSSSVRANRLVYGIGPVPRHYDPVEETSFFFSYPLVTWLGPSIPTVDEALGRNRDVPDPVEPSTPQDTPTPKTP